MPARLACAAALLAALAAPASAVAAPGLFLNGDSLAVGTEPYLSEAFPGWRLRTSASVSRHANEGPGALRSAGRLPRYIGVSLGTNDDPRFTQAFEAAIRDTMRIAGPKRCVIWANIVRPPVAGASYRAMNTILREDAHRRKNLKVISWTGMTTRHPGWLADDGVHVSAEGYRARARAYARAQKRCPRAARGG